MAESDTERLVVLDVHRAKEAMEQLRRTALVTQVLDPRLALIRDDVGDADRVGRVVGVLGVFQHEPVELIDDMTLAERLFIAAWAARRRPKARPGDGLSWEAAGFEPPDAPDTDRHA